MHHKTPNSISENNGLSLLSSQDQIIYSVGISTAGLAEIRMAQGHSSRHVIASTIDVEGANFTKKRIQEKNLLDRIEVKVEDIAKPLPYKDEFFDFVYARLVLHYLPKQDLKNALKELHRVLKKDSKAFIVVRAKGHLEGRDLPYDPETGFTSYTAENGKPRSRYFHNQESISKFLVGAGFHIIHVKAYEEHLCLDFQREKPEKQMASLIEVFASKNKTMERDLGEQPIARILIENDLSRSDLVSASTESITHKMVARACKGRRLTPPIQQKICNALNNASGKNFTVKELFNY